MKQSRREHQHSVAVAAVLPCRHFEKLITDHLCVDCDVTLAMVQRILWALRKLANRRD
jgi:hypothetical protein